MHARLCVCVYASVCVCVQACLSVCMCTCVCMCISLHALECDLCLCRHTLVCQCLFLPPLLFLRLSPSIHLYFTLFSPLSLYLPSFTFLSHSFSLVCVQWSLNQRTITAMPSTSSEQEASVLSSSVTGTGD